MIFVPDDLRLAVRRLRRSPGATLASVAALALGIAAAVVAWSLFSAVLLQPLPLPSADRLYQLEMPGPVGNPAITGHPYPLFEAVRESGAFDGIAANITVAESFGMLVRDAEDVPRERTVHFASHDFFATLGISAARGRSFAEAEDRPGAAPVAVLTDRYWRRIFNADPNVLGRTITVSGTAATVVGILPPEFRGLRLSVSSDIYLPLHIAGDIDHPLFQSIDPLGSQAGMIGIVGRLRPGDTPQAAAARLNAAPFEGSTISDGYTPLSLTNVNTAAIPENARAGMRQFSTLLSLTVGLLLLIGCLTAGMLLLVRTEDRSEELAVCFALGATRGRLASTIVAEAAVLCASGAAFAVPVSMLLVSGIRSFQFPGRIDIALLTLGFDPAVWLAVTGSVAAVTCVIALLASLMGIAGAVRSPLRSRALATPGVTRRGPRAVLVAGQVAITLVLVVGAGLFTRSMIEALRLNSGFATDRIVSADIDLRDHGYTPASAAVFIDEWRARLARNATIESVAVRSNTGFSQAGVPVAIDQQQRELPSTLQYMAVDDSFFPTIGLPLVGGRSFVSTDVAGSPAVAIVSESLAGMIADGGDAIGHRISDWASTGRVMTGQGTPEFLEIVGVVPDLITNVNATAPLVVYQPRAQLPPVAAAGIVVRAAGNPAIAIAEAVATVTALDPRVTPERVMTFNDSIALQMNPQRLGIYVLGTLGGIALLLTVLGTYVVAESMVVRRRRELSIRAALGADGARLRRLVLRDTAWLVGSGLGAGLLLTVFGARLIRSLLYQVRPLDPLVLASVSTLILGLALLVSLRPAFEATRLDLSRSLRQE